MNNNLRQTTDNSKRDNNEEMDVFGSRRTSERQLAAHLGSSATKQAKHTISFGTNTSQTTSQLPITSSAVLRAPQMDWRSAFGGQQSMDTSGADNNSSDNCPTIPTMSTSLMNFQMPQNFVLPQVMPSYPNFLPSMASMPGMPAFQEYLAQLPNLPTVSMPSIPNLSMPSMPNISMPSMPSMPNLPSIPSFSDFMNSFPSRKLVKPWAQLRQAVKNSHRRFSEIGCKVPFLFNWREDPENKRLRIYFLSTINNSAEITLIYCDIDTEPNARPLETTPDVTRFSNDVQQIQTNLNKEVVINEETTNAPVGTDRPIPYTPENDNSDQSDEEFMPMSGRRRTTRDDNRDFNPELQRKSVDTLWKPLIITSKSNHSFDSDRSSSREENLQLERKRIMFSGITSYEFQQKSSRFVFTSGETIYWFDDPLDPKANSNTTDASTGDHKAPPYLPHKLEPTTSFTKMNPQLCPSDPNLVAYVADGDLWVCNLRSGLEFRLTESKFDTDSGVVSAGLPSYVLQEEFRRYTGFWWRPDDHEYDHIETADGDLCYTILCEFVDESEVDVVKIANWDGTVEEYRFPRPGQPNADSSLSIVTFSLNPLTNLISDVKISSLPKSLPDIFPAYEYLVRCGWHSHDVIWLQLLNRSQSHLVLVLMSVLDQFSPQIIYEEKADNWINCHDVLHFFNTGDDLQIGSTVRFIWASEESGFRHLFQIKAQLVGSVGADGQPVGVDSDGAIDAKLPKLDKFESNTSDSQRSSKSETSSTSEEPNAGAIGFSTSPDVSPTNTYGLNSNQFNSIETLRSKLVSKVQLTHGNWEVSDKEVWVDEPSQLVYFTGLKESPLERHLYVISLQYPKLQPKRLTVEDFSHTSVAFNTNYTYFVDIQSNITIPPFGYLQKLVRNSGSLPDAEPLQLFLGSSANPGEDSDQIDLLPGMAAPQLFDYRLKTGDLIYGFIFKPECMEAGLRYPVLLEIYGGPEVQLVNKSFKAVRHCRRHLLASEGYIVVAFDSRGSKHRGVAFESHCSHRLGQVEISDQVEALQWLAANTDFIDMSRIAVHGWSYGGYLSLMALVQRPDIFKCAIAGAPVTNWQLYDTGYTERYMGTPDTNPEGYRLGNVMTHINAFPNEENRLLIIHGLMDENVHFAHTVQLIQALIKAGKPYQLNVYPFERHSLRQSQCSEHYETLLLTFLQNNL